MTRQVSWLPDHTTAVPSQNGDPSDLSIPVELTAFVPGYSGGGRAGFSPASLLAYKGTEPLTYMYERFSFLHAR